MNDKKFDAAAVAGRLTPAQARTVKRGGMSDERIETIVILADRYMLFYREPTPNTTCYTFQLTKFGHAVRDLLGNSVLATPTPAQGD